MKLNEGRHMVMHPAWQAAHELLADPEKWFDTVVMERAGYTSAQVATAMRCMGYGDDVIYHVLPGHYTVSCELPPVWIPVNHNNSLDAFPKLTARLGIPTLADIFSEPVDEGVALPAVVMAALNGAGD